MSIEIPEKGARATTEVPSTQQERLFDLRLLLREIWRWKWAVLVVTLLGVAFGINDARKFVPTYEAQMIVGQASEKGLSAPVGRGGGVFGAAQSLGLIRSSGAIATSFDHFKQTLGSRKLADVLQRKHGLMQKVYKDGWDAANNIGIQPVIDESSLRWRIKKFFYYNTPQAPDLGALARYVGGAVRIEPVPESPFFKISVKNRDRDFALYLLETAYKEADELLGEQDRHKQAGNKQYLKAQLEKTQLTEVRTALLGLLMQQEQNAMLVNSEPPYTIRILETPWVSRQPVEPQLAKIIGIPTAISLVICVVIIIIATSFRME